MNFPENMDREFRHQYLNLYGAETTSVFQAMKYFRQLLSTSINPDPSTNNLTLCLEPMVKGSMVPRFVELLNRYDFPQIQVESAWALTNIACGTTVETWTLIACGAAKKLVELITQSTNVDVRNQAVWAVSNIAGDGHDCREYLLQIGALEACLTEFNRLRYRKATSASKSESRRNLVWALSNLCRSRSTSVYQWHKFAPVVTAVAQLFNVNANLTDDELMAESCWTLAYLMDGNSNWSPIEAVLNVGLVARLVDLLSIGHRPNRVLAAVVRVLGNIVTGTAEQTQAVVDAGILPRLLPLLNRDNDNRGDNDNRDKNNRDNDNLVREACWLMSNITAGTELQIQSVLECRNLFGKLILLIGGHRSVQVRREATWAICNALSGGDQEQKRAVIRFGCVGPLCRALSNCEDSRLLDALLNAIGNIADIGEDQRSSLTFDNNAYALMIVEFGVIDQLKRLADEQRWSGNLRLRCAILQQKLREYSADNETKSSDDGPMVFEFIRNRALA